MTDMEVVRRLDRIINILSNRLPEREVERTRPEPADITEEPPVGSQVTDRHGDVWERREAGWIEWFGSRWGDERRGWGAVCTYAPFHPTTDADRERVGLPMKPACVCGSVDDFHLPACFDPDPADVDPDEAFGEALWNAFWACMDIDAKWELNDERPDWLRVARIAREHIEAEGEHAAMTIVREVEADLARVTASREVEGRDAQGWKDAYDMALSSLNKAEAKADRYDALRNDLEATCADAKGHAERVKGIDSSPLAHKDCARLAHGKLIQILARDDERGR